MDPNSPVAPVRAKLRQKVAHRFGEQRSAHFQHRNGPLSRTGQLGTEPLPVQPESQAAQSPAEDRFFFAGGRKQRPHKRPRPQSHYGAPPKKRPLFKKPGRRPHKPSPSYGAPEPAYGAPEPSYGAPEPSYNAPAPAPSYEAPDTYGAPLDEPENSYKSPEPSYRYK